jgi:hypothetical protein
MGAALQFKPVEARPSFKALQNAVTNFDPKQEARSTEELKKAMRGFQLEDAPGVDKARKMREFMGNTLSLPKKLREEVLLSALAMSGVDMRVGITRLSTLSALKTEVLDLSDQWDSRIGTTNDALRQLMQAYAQSATLGGVNDNKERTLKGAASITISELSAMKRLLALMNIKLGALHEAVSVALKPIGAMRMPEMAQVTNAQTQVTQALALLSTVEGLQLSKIPSDLATKLTDFRREVRFALENI